MNRSTALIALVAAGALLLAGCGKDSGSATAISQNPVAGTQASAAGGTDSAAAKPAGSEPSVPAASGPAASVPPTSGPAASGPAASGPAASVATAAGDPTAAGPAAGSGTAVNAAGKKWLSFYCQGLSSLVNLKKIGVGDPSQLKAYFKSAGDQSTNLGASFTTSATGMKTVAAPTYADGQEFASKIQSSFEDLGQKFTALGPKLAAANPNDASAIALVATFNQDIGDAARLRLESQNLVQDAAIGPALAEIPACKMITN